MSEFKIGDFVCHMCYNGDTRYGIIEKMGSYGIWANWQYNISECKLCDNERELTWVNQAECYSVDYINTPLWNKLEGNK